MAGLDILKQLSQAHCVLLAVQYATEADVNALRALAALRDVDLGLELVLRILLTYLPEGTEPSTYIDFLYELATDSRSPGDNPTAALDPSSVQNLSNTQARRRMQRLHLLPLEHPLYKAEKDLDPLSSFLIHRAHRIDAETGLLDLIAQLVAPFLGHSEYLRTWFISTVLPLLRLSYEYYPNAAAAASLDEFSRLNGKPAIEYQLSNLRRERNSQGDTQMAARDLRGVVGPWICGANDRKRRKLSIEDRRASVPDPQSQEPDDWECLFAWLLQVSKEDFPLALSAITDWDGPEDLDLGGYEEGRDYIGDETQRRVEIRYAQTALACLYVLENSDIETIQSAHALLRRIADLLNYDPRPNLNISIDSLPSYDLEVPILKEPTTSVLRDEQILRPTNPMTQPKRDTVRLLELFIFSTALLFDLRNPISVRELARMYLRNDGSEQYSLLQKILHALSSGSKKDANQWNNIRLTLLWLWNWGTTTHDEDRRAQGIFGKLESKTIETEILKALLESNHYSLAVHIYITSSSSQQQLQPAVVERVVLASAMHHYDNASNGNRTRGGMKRAADIIAAFSPHFTSSSRFQRAQALLSATHAMSFYSLILQHGVPFQPVNIRVSSDPLSLIRKLLSQNKNSYTHLDDLISIGQNLVVSMPSTLMDEESNGPPMDPAAIEQKKVAAERRVIGMAIEAALGEDDFETAYSYVVTRLTPPTSSPATSPAPTESSFRFSFGSNDSAKHEDEAEDVAWRAALNAGRYNSSHPSSTSWTQASTTSRPDLRRLEQRMELLSQALLLAPPRHLEEVLAVWQQCEAEMTTLLAEETEAEERFNDAADRKLPGAFTSEVIAVQPRREVGRGAVEEAPMGLFDVARGAAAAFSKSAFPLRGNASSNTRNNSRDFSENESGRVSMDLSDSGSLAGHDDRVRKRDMIANTVTGGLASGIGWVLGATPVQDRERQ